MRLGEIIQQYRARNKLSMGDFAKMSNLSRPYISMLEANRNSNGGKPIAPSIETLQKVSLAIGISFDKLLRMLGDEEIDVSSSVYTEAEKEVLEAYRGLDTEGQSLLLGLLNALKVSHGKDTPLIVNSGSNYGVVGGNFSSNVNIS